jgi:hypothetical protein
MDLSLISLNIDLSSLAKAFFKHPRQSKDSIPPHSNLPQLVSLLQTAHDTYEVFKFYYSGLLNDCNHDLFEL